MNISKKVKILVLIIILITFTLVITISYAYFASSININNNISYNTSLEDLSSMITSHNAENANLNIEVNLTGFDTFYRDETAVAKKYKNSLQVDFNNITENDLTCTFDYVFKWLDGTYTKSSGATNELTIEGPFGEIQVPNYTTSKITLGSGQIAARSGKTASLSVDITTRFYNILNVDQSSHAGKNYVGTVTVANEQCQVASSMSSYIASNTPAGYRGSSHSDSATQNLYRYVGGYQSSDAGYAGNVDNYICLGSSASPCPGGNLYRIMGVVAEDDATTGLEAGMIKVIRNGSVAAADVYGEGAGLTGNINSSNYTTWLANCSQTDNNWTVRPNGGCYPAWSDSNLNTQILNGSYLNNLTFADSIASVKWHCFQVTSSLSFTADEEYAAELCSTTPTKVNLMYSGDYLNSYDNGTTSASNSNPSWLVRGEYEWVLGIKAFNYGSSSQYGWVSNALMANGAYSLIYSSYYQNSSYGYNNISSRPTFYLNKGIVYASGNGTYASPFRVAL